MTVEEYFEQWWPYELPAEGFNKTAMLDYGNTNCKAAQKTTVTLSVYACWRFN